MLCKNEPLIRWFARFIRIPVICRPHPVNSEPSLMAFLHQANIISYPSYYIAILSWKVNTLLKIKIGDKLFENWHFWGISIFKAQNINWHPLSPRIVKFPLITPLISFRDHWNICGWSVNMGLWFGW